MGDQISSNTKLPVSQTPAVVALLFRFETSAPIDSLVSDCCDGRDIDHSINFS